MSKLSKVCNRRKSVSTRLRDGAARNRARVELEEELECGKPADKNGARHVFWQRESNDAKDQVVGKYDASDDTHGVDGGGNKGDGMVVVVREEVLEVEAGVEDQRRACNASARAKAGPEPRGGYLVEASLLYSAVGGRGNERDPESECEGNKANGSKHVVAERR